jgi:2-polyprenyl-6-methoxyphenol hydroxylase-like FAD-dependent oxidoreductase
MRQTDIAIVGAGLAGSSAAAMLARAGHRAVLIDPHKEYPVDFRCEKLDGSQVRLLHKTGLADAVLEVATPYREVWVARFGRVVEKRPDRQCGILYHDLVNTVRALATQSSDFIQAKASEIATGPDRQTVVLSNGEQVSARLVVVANGLNSGLRQKLGMNCEELSPTHSISVGFDVRPLHPSGFDFPALTYFPEQPSRIAYLTLFLIGAMMRANLFVYCGARDPWLGAFRETPRDALLASLPGLGTLMGAFDVVGDVKIRPADLYISRGERRPGVVLVGDAFATSCPAAGTGLNKVFTDVERLCRVHIPRWLASPGMGEDKIATFYDDPVKRACDAHSLSKAHVLRSLSTSAAFPWRIRRWGRSVGHLGAAVLRQTRQRLPLGSPHREQDSRSSKSAEPRNPF